MKRIHTISILTIAATMLLALGGCMGAGQEQSGSMSLMERFHSGKSLIGEDRTLTADSKDKNLTKDQQDARESYMRGLAYANQGRQELAFEQYSRATALDPNLTQARYQRGLILLEQNMPTPALEEFKAVMEQTPEFAPGYAAAGRVYFINGLYPEAEKLFAKALEVNPQLLDAYDHLGAIHNYNKQYDLALATFQKALMINPNAAYLYNNLGLAYSMLGRDADAVEAFRKAVMQGAPSAKAYNNMGLALCRMGKYREGLEAFRAASGEAAGWNNLGYFFFLDGQHERAIKSFEKAIELEPTYYERAAENLKRARLAAQFAEGSATAATRPNTEEDLFTPRTPVIPSAFPAPIPLVQPAAAPVSARDHSSLREQNLSEPVAHAASINLSYRQPDTEAQQSMAPSVAQHIVQAGNTDAPQANIARTEQTNAQAAAERPEFALHISSFRTMAGAQEHISSLHKKSIEARVIPVFIPGKGAWYRVVTGSFNTVAEAHASLAALSGVSDVRVINTTFFGTPKQEQPDSQAQLASTATNAAEAAAIPEQAPVTEAAGQPEAPIQPQSSEQTEHAAPSLRMATALMLQP